MQLVVATHNPDKLKDYQHYFQALPYTLISIGSLNAEEPEETGTTFAENALLKAQHAFKITQLPAFADDSGFCIRALGGLPGVYSARFAITPEGKKDFQYAFTKLEQQLGTQSPLTDFVCAIAYQDAHQTQRFESKVEGYFDFNKKDIPGFGYTPIFVPTQDNPEKLSLAEMGDARRRVYAARGKTTALLTAWLSQKTTV